MRSDTDRARPDGDYRRQALAVQNSSMLTTMAKADALIVRPPNAPAAKADERVDVIPLDGH